MRSLHLEEYVFAVMEAQFRLADRVGDAAWGVDMGRGTLQFTDAAGTVTDEFPMQLLGSYSEETDTWLWSWANTASNLPPNLLAGIEQVQQAARVANNNLFLEASSFALVGDLSADYFAVICTGFLDALGYYRCPYPGGALYVALMGEPPLSEKPDGLLRKTRVITESLSILSFHHREAVIAYLGTPTATSGNTETYSVHSDPLQITFDIQGRIVNLQTTLRPEPASVEPEKTKGGLLGSVRRLFGGG